MAIFEGISAAMGVLGALDKNRAQQDASNSAQAFSAQQYATRYQTQVKDMEAAGLNPMLSYSQSPGGGPVGVTGQMEGVTSGVGASALAAKLAQAQIDNVEADTSNKYTQEALLRSQVRRNDAGSSIDEALAPGAAAKQFAETLGFQASADGVRQAIEESKARINLIGEQIIKTKLEDDQISALIREINARTSMIPSQINNLNWDSLFKAAGISHLKAETLQIKSTLPAMIQQMQNLARLTGLEGDALVGQASFGSGIGGQIKPWASMISEFIPNLWFKAFGGGSSASSNAPSTVPRSGGSSTGGSTPGFYGGMQPY